MSSPKNAIRRTIVIGLVFVILSTCVITSAYAAQSLTPKRRFSFLRASGQSIVDGFGNQVLLRGADFPGYDGPIILSHYEADYVKMASWGFNVVRLPIEWAHIEPQAGQYDDTYLSKYVDQDIAWAKQHGIYIVLSMQQYQWSPYFTYYDQYTGGIPSWAVSGYPNTAQGEAQAKADFWNNLGPNGSTPSASNPGMLDRFKQMWMHVASRYAQEPTVVGYDLFNEPTVFTNSGVVVYDPTTLCTVTLPAFYNTVIDGIRTVDSNHIIFWESCAIYNMPLPVPPSRSNIVYSPHWNKESGYDGNTAGLLSSIQTRVINPANSWNQPVWFGEFCVPYDGSNAVQYIHDFGGIANTYGLSWAWWCYGRYNLGYSLLDGNGNERTILTTNIITIVKD
jgi:endoglycosylceramidase